MIGLKILFYIVGTFAMISTTMQILKFTAWFVRLFDFLSQQLLFIAVVVIIPGLFVINYHSIPQLVFLSGFIFSIAYQCYVIYDYTGLHKVEMKAFSGKAAKSLKILSSNVYQENREYHRLINLINEETPDIIVVMEVDDPWTEALEVLHSDYPFRVLKPLDNTCGMCLYSKVKIIDHAVNFMIHDDVPSFHMTLDVGIPIRLFAVHPRPPFPGESDTSLPRDAELILIGQESYASEMPVIITGDLNDVAWSHTTRLFRKVSGLNDPRVGRGFFNTFHTKYRFFRWPLDHFFFSKEFELIDLKLGRNIGSDHFPILAEVYLDQVSGSDVRIETVDEDVREEAENTLEEAREEGLLDENALEDDLF